MQFLILPRRRPVRGPSWRLHSSCLLEPVGAEAHPGVAVTLEARGRDLPRSFTTSGARACRIEAGEGRKLPTFRGVGYTGAEMRPSGYFGKVIVDLAGVIIPSQTRPVLRQHDHEAIVGHTTDVKITKRGIEVAGVLSGERHHVESVTVPARGGFPWQMSIGANPERTEWLEAGETATVNDREVTGPMTISRQTTLGEFSFVPLGADGNTSATISAAAGPLPDLLKGTALRFGTLNPAAVSRGDGTRGVGHSVIFRGALTDALARLATGRDRVALCANHKQELCSTFDSNLELRLSKNGDRVLFKLPTDTAAARLAAVVIRANQLVGLSLALQPVEHREYPELPGYLAVTRAEIIELSATRTPCDPECRLRAV